MIVGLVIWYFCFGLLLLLYGGWSLLMGCSGGKASFNAVIKQGSPHFSLEKFYKFFKQNKQINQSKLSNIV